MFRSGRAEEKEARRYNTHKEKAMEILFEKIQAEFEKEERGKKKYIPVYVCMYVWNLMWQVLYFREQETSAQKTDIQWSRYQKSSRWGGAVRSSGR